MAPKVRQGITLSAATVAPVDMQGIALNEEHDGTQQGLSQGVFAIIPAVQVQTPTPKDAGTQKKKVSTLLTHIAFVSMAVF